MTAQQSPLTTASEAAQSRVQRITEIDWSAVLEWEVLITRLVQSAIIIFLAILAYRLVKLFTRRLAERQVREDDPLVKRLREQRAQTVASLLNNVGMVTILVVTVLLVLGRFIGDIGPLLATVGILGLAISFGAQSLVKDVITGAFILMEGQYGIGDIIRVKDTAGLVEKITLRTTILRDLHGIVHIIPNGEIATVSNLTKTWSRAVLDIGVAYKEDVDHVMDVLREIGHDMRQDPGWGVLMIEDVEILGIDAFADSAVVIRMMVKTLPQKQFDVARELRRRIKIRFDREGIEIPFPHRTFYWGEGQMPRTRPDGAARALGEAAAGDVATRRDVATRPAEG